MEIKKYLILKNYLFFLKRIFKKAKFYYLLNKKTLKIELNRVWKIDDIVERESGKANLDFSFFLFGKEINYKDINWHKDYFSGFEYPLNRFIDIDNNKYYNQNIDCIPVWEQSRFYFLIYLSQLYVDTGNIKYYKIFKGIYSDWIDKNPYLLGMNWYSTMDIAIGSINLVICYNVFWKELKKDKLFLDMISKSLQQRAYYIDKFIPINITGLKTNHTASAFAGLFVLSLALINHPESNIWFKKSKKGLEEVAKEQFDEEGVNFESSICYHKLVLEILLIINLFAKANNTKFSQAFENKITKAFLFLYNISDSKGNLPIVGDNDSGRCSPFIYKLKNFYLNEHSVSYLEELFGNLYSSKIIKSKFNKYFPKVRKNYLKEENFNKNSKQWITSNCCSLKSKRFSLFISGFRLGQNGKGGHNHIDGGSYTLSINGQPVVVDPGSATYTRDKKERDLFRSYTYHNTIYNESDLNLNISGNSFWNLKEYYKTEFIAFNEWKTKLKIVPNFNTFVRYRDFELRDSELKICEEMVNKFYGRINLHPEIKIEEVSENSIKTNICIIKIDCSFELDSYEYSPWYNKKIKSNCIIYKANNIANIKFIIT